MQPMFLTYFLAASLPIGDRYAEESDRRKGREKMGGEDTTRQILQRGHKVTKYGAVQPRGLLVCIRMCSVCPSGGAENARLENAGLEISAPNCRGGKCMTGIIGTIIQGVENAGLENSGTGKVWNATCGIT